MKWGFLLLALAGCHTDEIQRLEQLKARLDFALEERKACGEEGASCVQAARRLGEQRPRLVRGLPSAELVAVAGGRLVAPLAAETAFRQALASGAGTHGVTLELRLGEDLRAERPLCTQMLALDVLGRDDDAATATALVLDLSRVAFLERAVRLAGARRGWHLEGALPWFCGADPTPPEPDAAEADAIPRSNLSGNRARLLREAIRTRGAELTWWRARTPYPPAMRAERATVLAWQSALSGALDRRRRDHALVTLLRNRQASIDRIQIDGGDVVVEGAGGLADPRVVFGDSWQTRVEAAPTGRFRVVLRIRT